MTADRPRPRSPRFLVAASLLGVLALLGWTIARARDEQRALVARARQHVDRGELDRALEILSTLRKEEPEAAEGLTLAAQALLRKGAVASARRALETSLLHRSDQADACKMLAAIYLSSGDGQRGISLLSKAAELDPTDFRPWFAMGKVQHDLGRLEESARSYAEALRRSPAEAEAREARLGRIRALLDAKQPEQAGREFDAMREVAPDDPEVLALGARQSYASGRLDEALDLASRSLASDPVSFDALLTRARARLARREFDPARHDLREAIALRGHDVAALQLMAQVERALGNVTESEATRQRAERSRERIALMDRLTREIAGSPNDPRPRFQMGQAAIDGDMDHLAYECFQAALDLDPSFQPARDGLQKLRVERGYDPRAGDQGKPVEVEP